MARTNTNGGAIGVTSVTNSDGTLIIAPNTGLVIAGVNEAHNFAWTGQHTFNSFLPTSSIFPFAPDQFVTKLYADSFNQGLIPFLACKYATTGAINLATNGLAAVDTGAIIAGDRILVKDQAAQLENGIYIAAVGAWTRATDFDITAEILQGAFFPITNGTANANTRWAQYLFKPSTDVLGVDPIAFTFISQSGIGTISGTGTDNHIMRWDGSTNAQDSDLIIDDVAGGITTVRTVSSALYFTTFGNGNEFEVSWLPATAGSGAQIHLYGQDGFGGGQGGAVSVFSGAGGATGIGGPLILSAGMGGTTLGRGGHRKSVV